MGGAQNLWDKKRRLKHASYWRDPESKHEPEHGYPDLMFSELFNYNETKKWKYFKIVNDRFLSELSFIHRMYTHRNAPCITFAL
jgi:hypothetical protein